MVCAQRMANWSRVRLRLCVRPLPASTAIKAGVALRICVMLFALSIALRSRSVPAILSCVNTITQLDGQQNCFSDCLIELLYLRDHSLTHWLCLLIYQISFFNCFSFPFPSIPIKGMLFESDRDVSHICRGLE